MPCRFLRALRWVAALVVCLGAPSLPAVEGGGLVLTEMVLVASRGDERELLLRSRRATLDPATRTAQLHGVRAEVVDAEQGRQLRIECDRADVEIESQSFSAHGRVRGDTGEGQRFSTEAVRYDREQDLLFSDTPVELIDASGSLRGDGFRYYVAQRRFELLGNVRVEQEP